MTATFGILDETVETFRITYTAAYASKHAISSILIPPIQDWGYL
jgi:hypothetical protein